MPRELKTLEEISDWLTDRVRQDPKCRDATVTVQYQLQDPDETGCNWSRDVVVNPGRGILADVESLLAEHFEEARRRFNVRK